MNIHTRVMNALHPGYGECAKCGGNWGWRETADHDTGGGGGLFLFCVGCDKRVTVVERWEALDAWKLQCLGDVDTIEHAWNIMNTEFVEWPR